VKEPRDFEFSRCGPKLKNKVESNFEIGAGEGVGKGGMKRGGRNCC
jgi:hypothetical protein